MCPVFWNRVDEKIHRFDVIFSRSTSHLLSDLLLCKCYTTFIFFILRTYFAKVVLQEVCGQ